MSEAVRVLKRDIGETDASFSPTVAVVIPVYKHSALLAEAVESVVRQQAPFEIAAVIVDDGCPFPETAHIGQSYALTHQNVFYLRKLNGGLSSARNYGIEFALRHFAGLDAIYFLDADNRITPTAIGEALRYMRRKGQIDWVYPNIDKFGIEWNGNYMTDYSRLLHVTFDNICEAGSLVSRRLLETGIRFDETMKSGFEDWDFWLQAIGRGFRGANYPYFGFEYRQRAESMLRDSNRTREGILACIRQKHESLFRADTLLAWEHNEAPRYAAVGVGTSVVDLFTDPTIGRQSLSLEGYVKQFWAAKSEPDTFGVPPFLLWMTGEHRDAVTRLGLVHNLLWLAERLCQEHHFVAIRFESNNASINVKVRAIGEVGKLLDKSVGWMCGLDVLSNCVDDQSEDWIRSLRSPSPSPKVAEIVISGPFTPAEMQGSALSPTTAVFATLGALRDSGYNRQQRVRWTWRSKYLPSRAHYFELLRSAVGAMPVMPRVPNTGDPVRVGFLLPIAAFGGVERATYAVARVLKAAGCEVHLFIFGEPVYNRIPENDGVFKTVNFFADDYPLWGGPHTYSGHELMMGHDEAAKSEQLLGFLAGLDVVINNQVAPVNAALGTLRRRGVKVLNYVHVLDRTSLGRAAGHPYLSLAFEHVYDAVLTCSRDMAEWLHSMGIPDAKLIHIQNAPSYPLPENERNLVLEERWRRPNRDRLNVLFLGRLDRQKGIERLFLAARDLQLRAGPADWRIIGSDVIDRDACGSWQTRFQQIGVQVEPPVYAARDLNKAFAWADVILLPSRWEGAPLTILEAQRLGCVPIATAVGAVGELIEHRVDGILIDATNDSAVALELIAAIEGFARDRCELRRMAETAAERNATLVWGRTVEPLVRQIAGWFPDRMSHVFSDTDGSDTSGCVPSTEVNRIIVSDAAARRPVRAPGGEVR
ncbi:MULTISPECIES: glycosyltransferase [Microvirga]|uniref:glycosyltransferase n=1 Tax=Microvirga TaxID=186650 RepID=UPI0021C5A491|nr:MULTISPECIES: glycosyltransferase [unclassified Microvirga]